MLLIAHRGNIIGPNPEKENTIDYIQQAIKLGYNCEIDIWVFYNDIEKASNCVSLYLGHDEPTYQISEEFLNTNKQYLWIHCKNHTALEYLSDKDLNCFYHDKDTYTITSKGIVWGNINSSIVNNMICVMPEKYSTQLSPQEMIKCSGICSDYIIHYKHILSNI
jgi:hypothetical protein